MSSIKINKEGIINFSIELFVLLLAGASYYQSCKINGIAEIIWGLLIGVQVVLIAAMALGMISLTKLPEPHVPWRSCLGSIFLGAYIDIGLTLLIGVFLALTWVRHILYRALCTVEERKKTLAELKRQIDLLAAKEMLDSLGIVEEGLKDNNIYPVKLNSVNKKIEL